MNKKEIHLKDFIEKEKKLEKTTQFEQVFSIYSCCFGKTTKH